MKPNARPYIFMRLCNRQGIMHIRRLCSYRYKSIDPSVNASSDNTVNVID
jgi:hypothetical protein